MVKKKFKELTIKDNFMFGAVMCDENNCKGFLERVLHIPIERVEVSKEKSIVYHPEYKGVRLDVYAKDDKNTHYDIEMQALQKKSIEKRCRYYHSQMDMELLYSGEDYDKLPNSYVIFICDFDPFGKKKYCYTFESICSEDKELILNDGRKSIFLSTKGENEEEVPRTLVNFLHFVNADLAESEKDFQDEFIEELQKSIKRVKESREMEERFMLFEEFLKEEREEARAEGHAEGLAEGRTKGRTEGRAEMFLLFLEKKGTVSEELANRIKNESDDKVLEQWMNLIFEVNTIEEFMEKM